MEYKTHLKIVIVLIFATVSIGLVGYMAIEGLRFIDALYMTVITLTTVGFKEVKDLSDLGRLFTIFLIILGVGVIAYSVRIIIELFLDKKIGEFWRVKRMKEKIEKLINHYIVCGYGRIGAEICSEFAKAGVPFVVIEKDPEAIEKLQTKGFLYVEGDAEENEILLAAGIERAKALLSVLTSDADNVFVTLSAKALNPKIKVAARATDYQAEEKLKRAGADNVISPYIIGGRRLAAVVIKPTVVDFLDTVVSAGNVELQMEEIQVQDDSEILGKSLSDAEIRQKSGAIIVAIVDNKGNFKINPPPTEKILSGEILIALGTNNQLKRLKEMVGK